MQVKINQDKFGIFSTKNIEIFLGITKMSYLCNVNVTLTQRHSNTF